jgi:hypothetical protein
VRNEIPLEIRNPKSERKKASRLLSDFGFRISDFGFVLVAAALGLAWVLARPCAGSWNDGSRLATVESLVDRHTWAIDESIFVRVPASGPSPYPPEDDLLRTRGTLDKLWIDGHFYSDKSPVPALLLAGVYSGWQALTGCTAASDPALFCKSMTFASSGLAFAVAVWCAFRLGRTLSLSPAWRWVLAGALALCTVSLAYTSHVNNHVLLLAVVMGILVEMAAIQQAVGLAPPVSFPSSKTGGASPLARWVFMGCLAGLGYAIDLGAGPALLAAVLLDARLRGGWRGVLLALAGALPWLALHHALNYALAGTWKPANAEPRFFLWPGCPFDPESLTGGWHHPDALSFVMYSLDLLFGKDGFLTHNLPLLLALPGFVVVWRLCRMPGHPAQGARPELLAALVFAGGTWLAYSVGSTNHAGMCCSVRWFVPLLGPGWLVLALLLRERPEYRREFLVLCGWGLVLGLRLGAHGAWWGSVLPEFWPVLGLALVSWAWCASRRYTSVLSRQCSRQSIACGTWSGSAYSGISSGSVRV